MYNTCKILVHYSCMVKMLYQSMHNWFYDDTCQYLQKVSHCCKQLLNKCQKCNSQNYATWMAEQYSVLSLANNRQMDVIIVPKYLQITLICLETMCRAHLSLIQCLMTQCYYKILTLLKVPYSICQSLLKLKSRYNHRNI